MGKIDEQNLDVIQIRIPEVPDFPSTSPSGKRSHPYRRFEKKFEKFQPENLGKWKRSITPRMNWFEEWLVKIFVANNKKNVPIAFKAEDGICWGLDKGCVGHLYNNSPKMIDLIKDTEGFIDAVKPTEYLIQRYSKLIGSGVPESQESVGAAKRESGVMEKTPLTSTQSELGAGKVYPDFPVEILETEPDERLRIESEKVIREGREEFRDEILALWSHRCAVTGTNVQQVIQAAHLLNYLGPRSNHPANGMPLRADIHLLFDRGLLGFCYKDDELRVIVSDELSGTSYYEKLAGKKLKRLPKDLKARPLREILDKHRQQNGLPSI